MTSPLLPETFWLKCRSKLCHKYIEKTTFELKRISCRQPCSRFHCYLSFRKAKFYCENK
ncbi:unnamed protein product [Acanthoscelides obtectus]|uniref:Uncharacterized protein n=1 Tax=Acanthoscelides obtectus TaxID=200917 RepID=A0A9P0JYR3_ACAOB|nr:unnamed protein product [Acanthoscelides obtectus]CAK1648604.1 hypothetical protein AOBTE_LOCUS15779 [Acanthoscelides obtectus]